MATKNSSNIFILTVAAIFTGVLAVSVSCNSSDPSNSPDSGPSDTSPSWTPPVEREVSLDGDWQMSVRYRPAGQDWQAPVDERSVQVPGGYFPFTANEDLEVEITYKRPLQVPGTWEGATSSGYHVMVEFDSVDYRATVALEDETGGKQQLGTHEGYLGRFAVDLGSKQAGTLNVRAWDITQFAPGEAVEPVARTTVQGLDPTDLEGLGWGINVSGILESVRLRLTGHLYLRNAFAATLQPGDPATVRIGAEIVPLRAGSAQGSVHYSFVRSPGGEPLASGTIDFDQSDAQVEEPIEVLKDVQISGLDKYQSVDSDLLYAQIQVVQDGEILDSRTVPFLNRRIRVSGNQLTENGRPFFLKGTVCYHTAKLLAVDTFQEDFQPVDPYQPHGALLGTRLEDLARQIKGVNATWVRPAHHVPTRSFHRQMLVSGIEVYQDFPLMWNIDYEALLPEEILRQFDEFLWRMAAEPACGIIALHNEAEIQDSANLADLDQTTQLLITMLERAMELTPHLVAVGSSGNAGSVVFPPNPDYVLSESVLDRHAYLSSNWNPLLGYREIAKEVKNRLATSDGRPVIWSEVGAGWGLHYMYLLWLRLNSLDNIEPTTPSTAVAIRTSLESWLDFPMMPDPRWQHLTLREFYATVACLKHLGVSPADSNKWNQCMQEQLLPGNDAQLILIALDYFIANRAEVTQPSNKDIIVWSRSLSASWVATQILESRMLFLNGGALCATLPWDFSMNLGVPMVLEGFGDNLEDTAPDTRQAIAAAYAPLAIYARTISNGGNPLEVFVLNDGESVTGRVVMTTGGVEIWSQTLTVDRQSVESVTVEGYASVVQEHHDKVAELYFDDGTSPSAIYRIYLP